ncbi:MAG: diaminopimelate decarboxylase [Propionibacteriaceae bacterium]|nr:diaminopimelate decarboxylase [Propionibacteriaceae bacterium]
MINPELAPAWLLPPSDVNVLAEQLWPKGAYRNAVGELIVGEVNVVEVADVYGTALYLLDEAQFLNAAAAYRKAFTGWNVYYASKALLTRSVVRWVAAAGLNLDVCSGNELQLALDTGFEPGRIALHGNNKSSDELALAMNVGVAYIVVDAVEELDRIEQLIASGLPAPRVLIRVKTGVYAHTHEYIATAHEDQKFGFSLRTGEAYAALTRAHAIGLDVKGVHSHIGSQIFDTAGFIAAASRLLELAAQYSRTVGEQLTEICLGGGFGIAYTTADTPLALDELARELRTAVVSAATDLGIAPPQCAIEPGRGIVGRAGVALYRVGVVKHVELARGAVRMYVSVDGGMSDNPRPALYGADYSCVLANRNSSSPPVLARVVGRHCESGDILVRDTYLPNDIRAGDLIAVAAVGAYCRALSSNYNLMPRPAIVALRDGIARLIVRRETFTDLMATDVG